MSQKILTKFTEKALQNPTPQSVDGFISIIKSVDGYFSYFQSDTTKKVLQYFQTSLSVTSSMSQYDIKSGIASLNKIELAIDGKRRSIQSNIETIISIYKMFSHLDCKLLGYYSFSTQYSTISGLNYNSSCYSMSSPTYSFSPDSFSPDILIQRLNNNKTKVLLSEYPVIMESSELPHLTNKIEFELMDGNTFSPLQITEPSLKTLVSVGVKALIPLKPCHKYTCLPSSHCSVSSVTRGILSSVCTSTSAFVSLSSTGSFYGVAIKDNLQIIVMEYVEGGSLEKVIQDLKKHLTQMDLDEKVSILLSVCSGLHYLHTLSPKAIVHRYVNNNSFTLNVFRDLKPANILLDRKRSVCKVCDFGLSKPFSTNSVNSLTNNIGTLYYMANELIQSKIQKEYATALDVYSFAIVMWELIFEESPYNYTNKDKLFFENGVDPVEYADLTGFNIVPKVLNGFRPVMPITFGNCSKWCSKFMKSKFSHYSITEFMFSISVLIQNCWNFDPSLRPSFDEIIKQLVIAKNRLK